MPMTWTRNSNSMASVIGSALGPASFPPATTAPSHFQQYLNLLTSIPMTWTRNSKSMASVIGSALGSAMHADTKSNDR